MVITQNKKANKESQSSPATKKDLLMVKLELKEEISGVRSELASEFKNEIGELRNEMLTSNDKIMKKLEAMSTEQTMTY